MLKNFLVWIYRLFPSILISRSFLPPVSHEEKCRKFQFRNYSQGSCSHFDLPLGAQTFQLAIYLRTNTSGDSSLASIIVSWTQSIALFSMFQKVPYQNKCFGKILAQNISINTEKNGKWLEMCLFGKKYILPYSLKQNIAWSVSI